MTTTNNEEYENRFDEAFPEMFYAIEEKMRIKAFIRSERSAVRRETIESLRNDMKTKMKHWHGTGLAMIDDYFTNLDTLNHEDLS